MSKPYNEAALGTIADFSYGYTATAQDTGDTRFIRITDIDENGSLKENDAKFIDFADELERYQVKKGDLLVARTGGTFGKTLFYKDDCPAVYASFLIKITLNNGDLLPDFYFHFSQSGRYWFQANNLVTGGGQPQFNANVLKEIVVPLPPLPEQKAIADLLSTWDKAIEKTERLIQAKVRQKLGELHSRISSQKANSTIGSFAKPVVRKVDKPEESYVAVGIRSHFKGTFQRLVEDPRTVNMDSLYRVKENDLILNITFAWEGAIALVKKEDEECYVSHRFPTYEIKRSKAEPCFIRQLIMSSRMKYDLSNISPGGAGRNRVLNKKDFLKMPIWLPDIETQKNIGEYLGAIDNEIDLLKELADKYKTQKRGLMQKMLTGEWRVKPEIVNQYMEA